MVRLNDLKNFIEISSFPSLSIAAKKLEVTQPALSESIKRLEIDLGFKVFYRTKNGISLTPEGKSALEKCKQVYTIISNLKTEDDDQNYPTVNIGCHSTIGSYFLPNFFKIADKEIFGYKIQLNHDLSRAILKDIQNGKIDIGVVVNPIESPDLIIKPFQTDTVHVWRAKNGKIQEQIIADTDLFQVQSILKKWEGGPKRIINTDNLDLVARMVSKGCGFGVIPERLVKMLGMNLVKVSKTPSFKDEFCIVYRPEFGKSKYERSIIDIIKRSF